MSKAGKLELWKYYVIESIGSVACTILQQGIYFWASARFHYTATENLLLGATQGLIYVLAASIGGKYIDQLGYDRVIRTLLAFFAFCALTLWMLPWHYVPFLIAVLFVGAAGMFWPSVEASIMHATSSLRVSQRLGIYNITWSATGSAALFFSGFFMRWNINSIIWLPGIIMASLLLVYLLPGRAAVVGFVENAVGVAAPVQMEIDLPTRRRFMHLHWLTNILAYLMASAFGAQLPSFARHLAISNSVAIWIASAYGFSRTLAFAVLMVWEGWHYRIKWTVGSMVVSLACMAAMFFSGNVAVIFTASLLFGLAIGLSYYGSLYYSMNYGENKGEHGGLHEAILGGGVLVGPLAGAGGAALFGNGGALVTVITLSVVIACGGYFVVGRLNRASQPRT